MLCNPLSCSLWILKIVLPTRSLQYGLITSKRGLELIKLISLRIWGDCTNLNLLNWFILTASYIINMSLNQNSSVNDSHPLNIIENFQSSKQPLLVSQVPFMFNLSHLPLLIQQSFWNCHNSSILHQRYSFGRSPAPAAWASWVSWWLLLIMPEARPCTTHGDVVLFVEELCTYLTLI